MLTDRIGLNLTSLTDDVLDKEDYNQNVLQRLAMGRVLGKFLATSGEGIVAGGATVVGDLTAGTNYPAVSLVMLDDNGEEFYFQTIADTAINFAAVSTGTANLYAVISLLTGYSPAAAIGGRANLVFIANDTIDAAPTNSILLGHGTIVAGAFTTWVPEAITINSAKGDHGLLTGLADDDHTQYAKLLGRAGGQTLIGGTAASNSLTLQTTSNGTKGAYILSDLATGAVWSNAGTLEAITWGDGVNFSAGTAVIDFNSTNLKITTNQINTIQDIATASSVQFGGIGIGTAPAAYAGFYVNKNPIGITGAGGDSYGSVINIFMTADTGTFYGHSLYGEISTGKTLTTGKLLWIRNLGGAGTVTTQTGIYIDDLVKGGTNYAIDMAGRQQIRWAGDTNLYSSAANTLKTDDALTVAGEFISNGVSVLAKGTYGGTSFTSANGVPSSVGFNRAENGALYDNTEWGFLLQHDGTGLQWYGYDTTAAGNTAWTFTVHGNIYSELNVSALTFTDRTPFYEGDAIAEIMNIKGKDGEVDHSTLPDFVKKDVEVKTGIMERPTEETVGGRDLGAMISMLTVAVQQLQQQIDELKGSITV